MKKKITLLMLVLVLISALTVIFVVSASAEEKSVTVTYNEFSGSVWRTATPNEDGSYTLFTSKKSGNGTVTLADGTKVDKVFYGWFTKDGTLYEPGATVTFTKDTQLYEAYGVEVFTPEDLVAVKINNYVKIGADMTIDVELKSDWGTSIYDLNGHTLTVTNGNHAIYNHRGATVVTGQGKLIHAPSKLNTNDNQTGGIIYQSHGYGDTGSPQLGWIGKNVEFETPYNFVRLTNNPNHDKMPNIEIFGKVTAKNFIRGGILTNSTVILHDSADVTLNGTTFFDCTDTTGALVYMNLTLGGKITATNSEALLLSDFLMTTKFTTNHVTSGSFTVSSADAERIAMFLPDTLMLKATDNGNGTVTYNVTDADCIHNWEKDTEASIEALPGEVGLDVFKCSKCGTGKQTVTTYTPATVEITVVVRTQDGDKEYKVLAGDVFDLQFNGMGAAALCYIAGLKDTDEFTSDMIVSIEIPIGVSQLGDFANTTLESIYVCDDVVLEIETLNHLTGLKTINVGKATVTFKSLVNSKLEKISSLVAGAELKFENNCFYKGKSIKTLEMCAGSKYTFGQNSFRECGLTELIFPDNATISWNKNAFAECQQLEYIYIGSNIGVKTVDNSAAVFDGISNLKKVVIMDLTYLGEWAFSTKEQGKAYGPLCDLTMYIHSEALTMHANSFNNRKVDYHVYIYTVQNTLPSTINNCNRVIYHGIGHAYSQDVITESTCVTPGTAGYVTDCPCGIDYRGNAYTTYSSYIEDMNNVTHGPFGKDIVELPLSTEHVETDIMCNITFENGYTNLGVISYKCLYCDEVSKTEETASFPALFICKGFSASKTGDGISLGFNVNKEAVSTYASVTGRTVKYGVFAVSQIKLGTNDIFDGNGNATDGVISTEITRTDFAGFDIKIVGFKADAQKEAKLALGAYVATSDGETTEYSYIQSAEPDEGEKYCFVSYNDLVENS